MYLFIVGHSPKCLKAAGVENLHGFRTGFSTVGCTPLCAREGHTLQLYQLRALAFPMLKKWHQAELFHSRNFP